MANYEATRYDISGSNLTNVQGVNTGLIIPWGSTVVPSGFLECDGSSVSTSTYAALFAVIAYTYGGAGASFLLPDLRDRTALSKSNNKALASTGGANTVTPTGNVTGTVANTTLTTAQLPAHGHDYATVANASGIAANSGVGTNGAGTSGSAGGGGAHNHSSLGGTLTASATSVLQPYLTLMYIIKT
jgi:microcystin-dependent protein